MMDRVILWPAVLAVVAVLAFGPYLMSAHTIVLVTLVATTAIIVSGLTIVTGLAGQITLAQAAFCAFGAYGATVTSMHTGVPMWATIPVSTLASAMIGYSLGVMSLRVEGHYLALVTLAFSGIVNLALIKLPDLTGGAIGMAVRPLTIGQYALVSPEQIYYVSILCAVAVLWGLANLIQSRWGRGLNALRQSEVAARSLGIDVRRAKATALAISAGLAALGGGLQSLQTTYLDPQQFTILTSVSYLSVLVIGGLRRLSGAVLGAAIFVLMPEVLGAFKTYMGLIFALILLAIILLAPSGIAGLFRHVRWPKSLEAKL